MNSSVLDNSTSESLNTRKLSCRLWAVGGGKGTLKTVLIIGAGLATAVGVTALAGGFSGSSGHRTVVSP